MVIGFRVTVVSPTARKTDDEFFFFPSYWYLAKDPAAARRQNVERDSSNKSINLSIHPIKNQTMSCCALGLDWTYVAHTVNGSKKRYITAVRI